MAWEVALITLFLENERKQPQRTRWCLDNCKVCSESNRNWKSNSQLPVTANPQRCSGLEVSELSIQLGAKKHCAVCALYQILRPLRFPRAVSRESLRRKNLGGRQTDLQRISVCGPHPKVSGLRALWVGLPLLGKHSPFPALHWFPLYHELGWLLKPRESVQAWVAGLFIWPVGSVLEKRNGLRSQKLSWVTKMWPETRERAGGWGRDVGMASSLPSLRTSAWQWQTHWSLPL